MKLKVWEVYLGAIGWLATINLKDFLSYAIGFATLILLGLRIYVTWKHRDTPPKGD